MPAVAIASVSSVAFAEQGEEVGRGRGRQEAGEEVRHHLQVAAVEELPRLELGEREQRPEDDDRDDERGRARARRRIAQRGRRRRARPRATRSLAARALQQRRRCPAARRRRARRRLAAAATRPSVAYRSCSIALVTAAVGRSKTISPPFMPIRRGNHLSARSTACSDASRVAPRASLSATSAPTLRSASAGSSADTGSSARMKRRPLVEHAGDADALQLAAREAIAAVEDAVAEVEPVERGARAGGIAGDDERRDRLPRRPGAEAAGEDRGDDAQARRDRRALVDDADRARAAAAARRRRAATDRRRRRRGALRSAAATCRGRARASSCRRPTGRSRRRARRAPRRERDVAQRALAVGVDEPAPSRTGRSSRRVPGIAGRSRRRACDARAT